MKSKVLVVGPCRIENVLYSKIYPLEDSELDTDIDEEFRIGGTAIDVCRALRTLQDTPSLLSTVPKVNPLFDR
ncbi:hypothetical protein AAVH_06580 [Aphelenchoides avenae]|nr:hypothetical protein AAVH_06580 [Aphelenchus avenae]